MRDTLELGAEAARALRQAQDERMLLDWRVRWRTDGSAI